MIPRNIFHGMDAFELHEAITAMLAARRLFEPIGSLASSGEAQPQLQVWADSHVDRLEADLRLASIAYLGLALTDPSEIRTRLTTLAGAHDFIRLPSYDVAVTISQKAGA